MQDDPRFRSYKIVVQVRTEIFHTQISFDDILVSHRPDYVAERRQLCEVKMY